MLSVMNQCILQRSIIDHISKNGMMKTRKYSAVQIIKEIIEYNGKHRYMVPGPLVREYESQFKNLVDNRDEAIKFVGKFLSEMCTAEELN